MKKEHMSWKEFDKACKEVVNQIKKSKFKPEVIFTIPRGGLPIATRLAYLLKIQKIIIDKEEAELRSDNILLVDNIADTGQTILDNFPRNCECKIATLHYKPKTSRVKPDFYYKETYKWVIYPWEV